MPVAAEVQELIDNCKWILTKQGGVRGYKVTSKINGNSIFLPQAGFRTDRGFYRVGKNGCYWTSTLKDDSLNDNAYELTFNPNDYFANSVYRSSGQTVRPVLSDYIMSPSK